MLALPTSALVSGPQVLHTYSGEVLCNCYIIALLPFLSSSLLGRGEGCEDLRLLRHHLNDSLQC